MQFPLGLFVCGFLFGFVFIDCVFDYNPDLKLFQAYYSAHFFNTLPTGVLLLMVMILFIYFAFYTARGSKLQLLSLVVLIAGGAYHVHHIDFSPTQIILVTTSDLKVLKQLQQEYQLNDKIFVLTLGFITMLQILFINVNKKLRIQ